ncbi:hypothetical protein AVEN_225862-1 [Araneus ventricosus]|uniref:Uncharacterized protein n=1 Tax=Araneus ventricosus TaxID=182803 RepID=A0A4Y2BCX7_ARAVE|nr:hypothetical protein AVEN_225862-1 [Araneus ventricosus]
MCPCYKMRVEFELQYGLMYSEGRGGLVVRSRLRGQRVPGTKPDSTKDTGPVHVESYVGSNVLPLEWCGNLERWWLRYRPPSSDRCSK